MVKEELKEDIKSLAKDIKEIAVDVKTKVKGWTEENPKATKAIVCSVAAAALFGLGYLIGRKNK